MDPIIIGALITAVGAVITQIIVNVIKKRRNNTGAIIYTQTIELADSIKKASNKFEVPVNLIKDSKVFKQRIQKFDEKLMQALQKSGFESLPPIHEIPELFASYSYAKTKYAQWGDKVDINIILKLIVERLKAFNQEDEIYYDQALNSLGFITTPQLKFLVFHHSTYGLFQFLANQSTEMLPDLSNFLIYLKDELDVKSIDIDHLISKGLIRDMSPKRYPEIITSELDPKIQELKSIIDNHLSKLFKLQIWGYSLSPVCRIITSCKIKELLNINEIGFIYPVTEFADLYVKNLIATANVVGHATPDYKPKPT